MVELPAGWALLLRTDFTDDAAWAEVARLTTAESPEGFRAAVDPVSDPALDGATWQSLRDAVLDRGPDRHGAVLFVADATTIAVADHPVLVVSTSSVDRDRDPDAFAAVRPFRCIPSQRWGVETNLNLSNPDWGDFAGHVDGAGVFRGF